MGLMLLTAVANVIGQEAVADTADNAVMKKLELQTVSPYFLQHQYLSVVASMVAEGDGYIFETPNILNTISTIGNGFSSPFADDDIKVEKVVVDGKDIFVWRFPEPQYLREALYMAFVPVDGHYKAFAISIGQMVDWEISTSTETARATFGRVKKPDSAKECIDLLVKRGALTGEIKPGDFFQEGYTAPEYRQ